MWMKEKGQKQHIQKGKAEERPKVDHVKDEQDDDDDDNIVLSSFIAHFEDVDGFSQRQNYF